MKEEFIHLLYRALDLVKQKLLKSQSEKLRHPKKRKAFHLALWILERKTRLLGEKKLKKKTQKTILWLVSAIFLFLKESSSEQTGRSSINTVQNKMMS